MKSLVLAEKPSVARDIARVLNCSKKLNGALEGPACSILCTSGYIPPDPPKLQDAQEPR